MIRFWIFDFRFGISRTSILGFVLGALLLTLSGPVEAQQREKIARIGEFDLRGGTTLGTGRKLFRQSLRELGYVEGKNVRYETRSAEGNLIAFLRWLTSWSVLKLTYSSLRHPRKRSPLRMLPRRSRLFSSPKVILLPQGWLIVWHGPGETSRESAPLRRN